MRDIAHLGHLGHVAHLGHIGLGLAICAVVAAALPSPGLYVALGLGIAAVGAGWAGYRRTEDPGFTRLAGAAAITLGALGGLLGALRVVLVLAAIDRLARLLG
jgi:hypothetical protein